MIVLRISAAKVFAVLVICVAHHEKTLTRFPTGSAEATALAAAPSAMIIKHVSVAPLLTLLDLAVTLVISLTLAEFATATFAHTAVSFSLAWIAEALTHFAIDVVFNARCA